MVSKKLIIILLIVVTVCIATRANKKKISKQKGIIKKKRTAQAAAAPNNKQRSLGNNFEGDEEIFSGERELYGYHPFVRRARARGNRPKIKVEKPRCLKLWEKCMVSPQNFTAAQCDDHLTSPKYNCPLPKSLSKKNRNQDQDYDYVVLKETVENDTSISVEERSLKKN